ncbi:MAG: SocA family protein [Synergistaceae bacterium]|nr:SocA family protein [Synergistaceae bacterium]
MIPFQEQKTDNAIAYFASGYKARTGSYPFQMWLYKALALLDFTILREKGTPCLGLDYEAMNMGPVPVNFYFAVRNGRPPVGKKYQFVLLPDMKAHVENTSEPDLDYFSDSEIDTMDDILDKFSVGSGDIDALIDRTHEGIRAWKTAWALANKNNRRRMEMNYSDEFEGLLEKDEKDLTPQEERFICYMEMVSKEKALIEIQ